MLVALAAAVPFLLLTAGIVWQLIHHERETQREAILFSARALMNAVDSLLAKQLAIAGLLANSPALLADDFSAFRLEAERALPGLSGGWVVVADRNAQQLVNLYRPLGVQLPPRNPAAADMQRRALETGQPQVSNVLTGAILAGPIVTVEVPVIRPGKPPLGLAVVMSAQAFKPLLEQRYLPEGWLGGLIDRNGRFITRSHDHDGNVGRAAPEAFHAASQRAKEGWNEVTSIDGTTNANGHVTSELSGWVVGLAADKSLFEAPIRRTIVIASLAGGGATILSMLLAVWAARRIAAPIERIEEGTGTLLRRKPIAFAATGVPEIDRALEAFTTTAEALERHERERDERESHVRLLMRELSHRSKNLLAIVLAIARQTARQTDTFEEFDKRFNARIQALADAHDLLVEKQWVGASLDDLVRAQLSAFGTDRVAIKGKPVMLRAEAVQNVGLALHELATNASKYGALSVPEGKVDIEWRLNNSTPDSQTLDLTWRESGGPPVKEPTRNGFGRFVLERATVSALGKGALEFNEAGLVWACAINAEHLVEHTAKPAAVLREATARHPADQAERRAS